MPLPFILGAGAVLAGLVGVTGISDGNKTMKASDEKVKAAQKRHEKNVDCFNKQNEITNLKMDELGKLELETLKSFEEFSNLIEQIQGRPEFIEYKKDNVAIPKYNHEELKKVSVGAGAILGGLQGATLGAVGGVAASGATYSAVMALGTASTGTAISALSGIAAENAALAALGGGSLAAGGGGIALGTSVLGYATLGVGLLVGGIAYSMKADSIAEKAGDIEKQMLKAEEEITRICDYLVELNDTASNFYSTLSEVHKIYTYHLNMLSYIITVLKEKRWEKFSNEQKILTENTALLVNLLYNMCKVQLVLKTENEKMPVAVNCTDAIKSIDMAGKFLHDKNLLEVNA